MIGAIDFDDFETFTQTAIAPDLSKFDVIAVSTSGGKDSQAMLSIISDMARDQGVLDRVIAIHADLGRAEWKGVTELVRTQCEIAGVPLTIVDRELGDLLDHIEERGMFPSQTTPFCTSDHKRDQITKVYTGLTKAAGRKTNLNILECVGLRAQESSARAKRPVFILNTKKSTKSDLRKVYTFHPILDWTAEDVWAEIERSGMPHHKAYDLGMPRLSCVFCINAPKSALMIAGQENPELLQEYVDLEARIGHTFKNGSSLADIADALREGERVTAEQVADDAKSWTL